MAKFAIQIIEGSTPAIDTFSKQAWAEADQEHFGPQKNEFDFNKQKFSLTAVVDKKICGLAKLQIKAGVCRVDELFVSIPYRRQGLGTKLIKATEKIARTKNCHKMTLTTGKAWESVPFYQTLGYQKVADFPNYYARHDFIELAKDL